MSLSKNKNFLLILSIVIMAVMGRSIIGPILPALVELLGTTKTSVGWILSVYTLFTLIFTPILGVLADRIGRKIVIVPCVLLFGIASVAIVFANNFFYSTYFESYARYLCDRHDEYWCHVDR